MRLLGLSVLLFVVVNTYGQEVAKKNVLFIGNSLTYYSGMPDYLKAMLQFTNESMDVDVSAYPGMSLEAHLDNIITSRTENGINTRKKRSDEQTIRVLIAEFRKYSTEMAIERLKKLIDNPACKLILFKTWDSGKTFPVQFCYPAFMLGRPTDKEKYCSVKFNSLQEQISSLSTDYDSVAAATSVGKVNVGDLYYESIRKYPAIELYDNESHPTKLGAYLNACIFYKLLLDGKPMSVNYYGDLRKEDAILLQRLADR